MSDFYVTDGPGAISAWDQAHAEALGRLRNSRAFILIDVATGEESARCMICSFDAPDEAMVALLCASADMLIESAERLSTEDSQEDAA